MLCPRICSTEKDRRCVEYPCGEETAKTQDAKALSSAVKDRRKDRAAKFAVPLPKVRGIAEEEMFKVLKTGKSKSKSWKRMVSKPTFVGEAFTRKPVKLERFIRPMGLRMNKAHVTHREFRASCGASADRIAELKATFQLPILGVKKNPQSPLYTSLGVLSRGTILEVGTSDLGLVTSSGKVVWSKYAQVTNNPGEWPFVLAMLWEEIPRRRGLWNWYGWSS